jgi:hypothetical protein
MRAFLAGTLIAVALAVAGCGSGSSSSGADNGLATKSAQQVVDLAVTAAKGASSLHLSGQITTSGRHIGVDLSIATGKGATGTMVIKGQTVNLIVISQDAYVKAPAAFYSEVAGPQGALIAQLVGDKWLKVPTTDPRFLDLLLFINPNKLFDALKTGHKALTNKGATTYDGQSVVQISEASSQASLYVASTGAAFPVAIVKQGADVGALKFDHWNTPVALTAPSDFIDVSKLLTGG